MFKAMNVLTKRVFRNNKARNLVAILAIILTTLMFTTLFVLSQSMSKNLVEMAFRQTGYDAHASFKTITDAQIEKIAAHPDVRSYGRSIVVGVAENEALSGRQTEIRYGSDDDAKHSFSYPTEGRMPQSDNEIALDDIVLTRLGIPCELGQQVTIEWRGDFTTDEVTSSTFTLCGYWEGNSSTYASMAWVSEGFALEACGYAESNAEGQFSGMRMMKIELHSDRNIEKTIDDILKDTGLTDLEYHVNLAYDPSMQSMATLEALPMYLGMGLVFVAGYLIIYNIFQISVAADIQFYGKLKTLGTGRKQIRKLIYGQANRLCIIGIPVGLILGYLLGMVLVPILISGLDFRASASASPVIFIGSALFAWLTVLISCLRPARIAGKVSPIEALRYTDAQIVSKRTTKKRRGSASVPAMAWANLGRNKKRTFIVICSLTLGLVLMTSFYARNASYDMDVYLSELILTDFEVSDSTSRHSFSGNGYNPQGTTISEELLALVHELDGLEEIGHLYSQETVVSLSEEALLNTKSFFEKNDRLAIMEENTAWLEEYYAVIDSKESPAIIYGIDGIAMDAQTQKPHILEGTFDAEKYASGDYILAVAVSGVETVEERMPTFSVGEMVNVEGKEFMVMAIMEDLTPITVGGDYTPYNIQFILPTETFRQLYPDNTIRKLFFNVSDETVEAAETMLLDYQQNVDMTMPFESRKTMEEQYASEIRSSAVMGNTISVVIALVGVLNFVNSMVTAIVSRKKEFAMIQSVGMTKAQLRKMLIFEGLAYAGLTLAASYVISALAVGIVVRAMMEDGFSTFRFTLLPLNICTPIVLAFAVIIPYICFKNLEKQSIVERLRTE